MQELSLRRHQGRDLPSYGSAAERLLSVGPADRIGPLPRGHLGRSEGGDGPLLPALLLAVALASAAGTYALVRTGPKPGLPAVPAAVAPPPPATPPVVERIPEAVPAPPPDPVVATPPPAAPQIAAQPQVRPKPKEQAGDPATAARTQPAPHPTGTPSEHRQPAPREEAGAPEPARKRAVRTIRRPTRPASPAAVPPGTDVETTGAGRARGGSAQSPKHREGGPAGSWTLPSVLRPGGI